jgi:murein DD-endopeptidase MepM/ murein hydrolase activator NlpD
MLQKILTVLTVMSFLLSIVATIPTTEAVKTIYKTDQSTESSQVKEKSIGEQLSNNSSSQSSTKKQSKPVIVDGEIDMEPDTKMSKDEEKAFKQCKKEEKQRRSKRNQKKPTSCRKVPVKVHEELTDQDYTVLIDQIQEKNDIEDKKDMNIGLPLESYLDTKNISSISSISSVSSNNSSSLTNNLSSSSESKVSSSVIASTVSSQNSTSNQSQSSESSNSKTSFMDWLFPSIKAEAAGIYSDGYRFPYPSGVRIKTNYTFDNGVTHPGHNALDFYAVNSTTGAKYNENIVAAKSGTVYLSNPSTAVYSGIGENVVIKQDDGNYALYAHLSNRSVSVGNVVTRGQKIGVQGDTGTRIDGFNNSHLHFEVLQSGIVNYSTACTTNFNNCWNAFTIDGYKVIPQFDECHPDRGGLVENEINCKLNGVNQGYPYKPQSANYWTSVNKSQGVIWRNVDAGNQALANYSNYTKINEKVYTFVDPSWTFVGMGDFNGDSSSDVLWRKSDGNNYIWQMVDGVIKSEGSLNYVPTVWSISGIGDFNGDGKSDILWRKNDGSNYIWFMNNRTIISEGGINHAGTDFKVAGVADFDSDGKADIFWRNTGGTNVMWNMNGLTKKNDNQMQYVSTDWKVGGLGDFNGDGKKDIFWRNDGGNNYLWNMNNYAVSSGNSVQFAGTDYYVAGIADFDLDGKDDLFWRRNTSSGENVMWNMNNHIIRSDNPIESKTGTNIKVMGIFKK